MAANFTAKVKCKKTVWPLRDRGREELFLPKYELNCVQVTLLPHPVSPFVGVGRRQNENSTITLNDCISGMEMLSGMIRRFREEYINFYHNKKVQ